METNSESVSLSISPSSFLPSLHRTPSPYKRQHRTLTTHWLTHWQHTDWHTLLTHWQHTENTLTDTLTCPQSFISDYQIFMWLQLRVGGKDGWEKRKRKDERSSLFILRTSNTASHQWLIHSSLHVSLSHRHAHILHTSKWKERRGSLSPARKLYHARRW